MADAGARLTIALFFLVQDISHRMELISFRWLRPILETCPSQTCPEVCFHGKSKSHPVDKQDSPSHQGSRNEHFHCFLLCRFQD